MEGPGLNLDSENSHEIEEILSAAKQLSVDDRKLIVQELNESLPDGEEPFALPPEWMAEIQRRAVELDAHLNRGDCAMLGGLAKPRRVGSRRFWS